MEGWQHRRRCVINIRSRRMCSQRGDQEISKSTGITGDFRGGTIGRELTHSTGHRGWRQVGLEVVEGGLIVGGTKTVATDRLQGADAADVAEMEVQRRRSSFEVGASFRSNHKIDCGWGSGTTTKLIQCRGNVRQGEDGLIVKRDKIRSHMLAMTLP